jgi:hypothetical protein
MAEPASAGPRRRRRSSTVLVVVLVVVLAAAAVLLGYASARAGRFPGTFGDDTHGAVSWVGQGLIVVGLGVELWGLVRLWRGRRGRSRSDSPLVGMSGAQRRTFRDQLRGRRPVDPGSLPTTRLLAETTVREYGNLTPVLLGLLTMEVGQLLIRTASAVGLLVVASFVILAVALVWCLVEVRRARRFLARSS